MRAFRSPGSVVGGPSCDTSQPHCLHSLASGSIGSPQKLQYFFTSSFPSCAGTRLAAYSFHYEDELRSRWEQLTRIDDPGGRFSATKEFCCAEGATMGPYFLDRYDAGRRLAGAL